MQVEVFSLSKCQKDTGDLSTVTLSWLPVHSVKGKLDFKKG